MIYLAKEENKNLNTVMVFVLVWFLQKLFLQIWGELLNAIKLIDFKCPLSSFL